MPLFEIGDSGLLPFRQVHAGPELYESEIEDLVWADLEAFTGESLFPIARQARLTGGGRPDVVALDESGSVVVIEIKRDVDRSQLAQCLEYAGWARTTNLDELAGLYSRGPEAFFTDWQEFTDSVTPRIVTRTPRVVLIARDFEGRTHSALDFLRENGLPVLVVPVTIYDDERGRRFVDVEADHEPAAAISPVVPSDGRPGPRSQVLYGGRRVQVADLLAAGLLEVGEPLIFPRPRKGQTFDATVEPDGALKTSDGQTWPSPSLAAMRASGMPSCDGWLAWRVPRLQSIFLGDVRKQFIASSGVEMSTPDRTDVEA